MAAVGRGGGQVEGARGGERADRLGRTDQRTGSALAARITGVATRPVSLPSAVSGAERRAPGLAIGTMPVDGNRQLVGIMGNPRKG
ncbi:hypothetical protein [Streptomyces eurythermus]|uniref:hypothetical protein n=1 Tax=Streptomyces eurythermus TaxID=42237 RepID=UPI0036D2C94E